MPARVQCPISSSLGEFSQLLGLALVSWAFARIGVHRPSLRLPYLVFSIRSYLTLDFNRVSSLRPTCIATHSVDPSLTRFLGEFPGFGLALAPDVVVPEAEQRCEWSRKLDPNFCPGGVEPRTLASSGRRCCH